MRTMTDRQPSVWLSPQGTDVRVGDEKFKGPGTAYQAIWSQKKKKILLKKKKVFFLLQMQGSRIGFENVHVPAPQPRSHPTAPIPHAGITAPTLPPSRSRCPHPFLKLSETPVKLDAQGCPTHACSRFLTDFLAVHLALKTPGHSFLRCVSASSLFCP